MSFAIDYLPDAYRARVVRARHRRERLLLAIPLLAALLATDSILRMRVRVARQVAMQAAHRADQGEQRAEQTRQLARRVTDAKLQIEAWVAPLAAPRMTALLDALLADQPDHLTVQELACRHQPWAADPSPTVRLVASCESPAAFTAYTTALGATGKLPRLLCQRTFRAGGDDRFGFHLESSTAAGVIR